MIVTYDSERDALYMFAAHTVADPNGLEEAASHRIELRDAISVFLDETGAVLGLRCLNASTDVDLAGLPLQGIDEPGWHIKLRRELRDMKSLLDGLQIGLLPA